MNATDSSDAAVIIARLREQASNNEIRVSVHAHQRMVEHNVTYDDVREVLLEAFVVENYPDHKRGPCCLVCGLTREDRYLHVVCTTSLQVAIIVTVYEPTAPKWVSPSERGGHNEL
jgi:hypothetical protein